MVAPEPTRGQSATDASPPGRSLAIFALLGAAVVVVALLVRATTDWFGLRRPADPGLLFVIPEGSAANLTHPTIDSAIDIPPKITFRAGETAAITIRNDDSVAHRAGPFVVDARQTFVQRFP